MKRIARNDNRPFLKSSHLTEVETRIARFKGSAALAANIRNASANAALIKSTAAEKSLQPQLLAVAAMAKALATSKRERRISKDRLFVGAVKWSSSFPLLLRTIVTLPWDAPKQ